MLARSWLAVLGGCVATVAAYRDDSFRYANQDAQQHMFTYPELPHGTPPRWDSFPGHSEHLWPGLSDGGPPHGRMPPGASHHPPKFPDKTVYEVLRDDDRFSRVFRLINFAEDIAASLNDPASTVTFFAPPNRALRPPRKHDQFDNPFQRRSDFNTFGVEDFFTNDVIGNSDKLELFAALEGFVDSALLDDFEKDNGDDEDKERRKKILKKIVSAVLRYHTIGVQLHARDLAKNTTFPSSLILEEGSLDDKELRIRVEQPKLIHPSLTLNFYARVIYADVETKNGIIHAVNHPLFPPPSTFQILFSFFDIFSTLTSAIQHVNFTDAVDWHWDWKSKTLEGSPAVTFFAPTNQAFSHLPNKLKLFLFSPFGAKALKKILSYHVVPDYVFHSNWVHNATDDLLPMGAIQDYPLFWMKDTVYPEEEYSRLYLHVLKQEAQYDNLLLRDQLDGTSRPEAEGYGYMGGAYEAPRPDPHIGSFQLPRSPCIQCPSTACKLRADRVPPSPCLGPLFHPLQHRCPHMHSPPPLPPPPSSSLHHHKPIFEPVYTVNATLPTLLGSGSNHTLNVHVAQFRSILPHGYVTKVFVNGQWVVAPDVPTRNGAIHVVKRLIKPRGHGKHGHGGHGPRNEGQAWMGTMAEEIGSEDEWNDWEEWLPQWANED